MTATSARDPKAETDMLGGDSPMPPAEANAVARVARRRSAPGGDWACTRHGTTLVRQHGRGKLECPDCGDEEYRRVHGLPTGEERMGQVLVQGRRVPKGIEPVVVKCVDGKKMHWWFEELNSEGGHAGDEQATREGDKA